MAKSAGLLLYRRIGEHLQVLLAHPGGPYFAKKDEGSWTVPKGLVGEGELEHSAAVREFEEETSFRVEASSYLDLGEIRQKGGKVVHAWACEGEADPDEMESNLFEMEWPPRSGRLQTFPEIDRIGWFSLDQARSKMIAEQQPFLDRLLNAIG